MNIIGRGAVWVVAMSMSVVVATASTAFAGGGLDVGDDGHNVDVHGHQNDTDQTGGPTGGNEVITIPKPYKEYGYIPACSANDIEGGADTLCGAAVFTCPGDGEIRYRVYTRQHDADGSVADGADWEPAGTQCRGPDDPPEGGPVVITTTDIEDEARKAAPATTVHVEPVATSYVNVPTNFYADSTGLDTSVEVLGQTIGLRFEPTGFAWTFGDGTSGSGAGIQHAAVGQAGAVEHAYRRSGTAEIALTRTFQVTYTLPGGRTGTLPAPGVTSASAPYALRIGEVQSLVTGGR